MNKVLVRSNFMYDHRFCYFVVCINRET